MYQTEFSMRFPSQSQLATFLTERGFKPFVADTIATECFKNAWMSGYSVVTGPQLYGDLRLQRDHLQELLDTGMSDAGEAELVFNRDLIHRFQATLEFLAELHPDNVVS